MEEDEQTYKFFDLNGEYTTQSQYDNVFGADETVQEMTGVSEFYDPHDPDGLESMRNAKNLPSISEVFPQNQSRRDDPSMQYEFNESSEEISSTVWEARYTTGSVTYVDSEGLPVPAAVPSVAGSEKPSFISAASSFIGSLASSSPSGPGSLPSAPHVPSILNTLSAASSTSAVSASNPAISTASLPVAFTGNSVKSSRALLAVPVPAVRVSSPVPVIKAAKPRPMTLTQLTKTPRKRLSSVPAISFLPPAISPFRLGRLSAKPANLETLSSISDRIKKTRKKKSQNPPPPSTKILAFGRTITLEPPEEYPDPEKPVKLATEGVGYVDRNGRMHPAALRGFRGSHYGLFTDNQRRSFIAIDANSMEASVVKASTILSSQKKASIGMPISFAKNKPSVKPASYPSGRSQSSQPELSATTSYGNFSESERRSRASTVASLPKNLAKSGKNQPGKNSTKSGSSQGSLSSAVTGSTPISMPPSTGRVRTGSEDLNTEDLLNFTMDETTEVASASISPFEAAKPTTQRYGTTSIRTEDMFSSQLVTAELMDIKTEDLFDVSDEITLSDIETEDLTNIDTDLSV